MAKRTEGTGRELAAHLHGLRRLVRAGYLVQDWYLDMVEVMALDSPGPIADRALVLVRLLRERNGDLS